MPSKPQYQEPSLETWRALYDAAIRFKELAPWQWMEEIDVFGVQDPETGRIGFVSIMGALGEHFALSAYLDALGLYQFWEMQQLGMAFVPEKLLEIEQLTASFENRNELTKRDRDIIKALGLRFRGKNAWPLFRKINPGYLPWYVDESDARFLTHLLEQSIIVAQRQKEDPDFLAPEEEESMDYLVRVPHQTEQGLVWEDTWMAVPPPEIRIPLHRDEELIEYVRGLPQTHHRLEMDYFMMPIRVKDDYGRPFVPYMLMAVDRDSGYIYEAKLLAPIPSLQEMWAQIPMAILAIFAKLGGIPTTIYYRSPFLEEFLEILQQDIDLRLHHASNLRQLDQAKQAMMNTFA